jgi:toxin-antitoxin system PIN domain toxin
LNDLLDVNVWLALIDQRHVHHALVARYWNDDTVRSRAFCRMTANALLRLSTHARAMPDPLSPHEAWITYRQFLSLPIIRWLPEPPGLDDRFCALSCAPGFAHHLWTDAYLAALAQLSGCRLVSLDGDFKRFEGLQFLHLRETDP